VLGKKKSGQDYWQVWLKRKLFYEEKHEVQFEGEEKQVLH
jgi:hypothetical protein